MDVLTSNYKKIKGDHSMVKYPKLVNKTKADLVRDISNETKITQGEVNKVIASLTKHIIKNVESGKRIYIPGLGSWTLKVCSSSNGINPQTLEKMKIPASVKVKHNTSSDFEIRVKESKVAGKLLKDNGFI